MNGGALLNPFPILPLGIGDFLTMLNYNNLLIVINAYN